MQTVAREVHAIAPVDDRLTTTWYSSPVFPSTPNSRQKPKTLPLQFLPLALWEEIPESHFYSHTAQQGRGQESPSQQIRPPWRAHPRKQGAYMAPLAELQTDQVFLCYSFPPRAWPNPPPVVWLPPTLGQSLAGTMSCHSNLLEGQKEIINQSQHAQKKSVLHCSPVK